MNRGRVFATLARARAEREQAERERLQREQQDQQQEPEQQTQTQQQEPEQQTQAQTNDVASQPSEQPVTNIRAVAPRPNRGRILATLAAARASRQQEAASCSISQPQSQPAVSSAGQPQPESQPADSSVSQPGPQPQPTASSVSQPQVQPAASITSQPQPQTQPVASHTLSQGDILATLPSDVHRTRRGSDASNQSALSQHFQSIDSDDNFKAHLPKDPSTAGQEITLSLNYMTFNVNEGQSIEEYHVDFNPNIESIRLRYHLLRSEAAQQIIGTVVHWTGTNLYLPIKLPERVAQFESLHPVTNAPVHVKLTHVKTPPDSELMPFYNSLMHKVMNKLRYVIINRQHYSPVHKISIEQHKLEVWPGWITSIQRLDGGLKLAVDSSFRVLRLETVRDVLMDIKNRSSGMNLIELWNQQLVGSIIMTRYNNKAYKIDEITTTIKPTSTFTQDRNGRDISYADYLREHWNVEVKDLNQPMIIHRPKPKRGQTDEPPQIALVPEVCVTTGLTDEMRANFNIMRAIHEHTRLPPDTRECKLVEFLQQLSTDERAKSVLSEWNLSVRPEMDIVKGRRLDSETIYFGGGRSSRVPENADWTRPATNWPVFKSVDIKNWVIMFTDRDAPIAEDFMGNLCEVSRQLSINISPPRIIKLPSDSAMTYVNYGKREVKSTDQLVVLLTPGKSQREDRYSACKRLYSCEIPVPCQFIRCGTVQNPRKLRAICQKIALQILCKVGGQPWAMRFPMKSFMVIGVDVYHDTIDRKKSCVGFTASMNEYTSHWWSQTFFQNSLEEINQKLSQTVMNAIKKYHSINGFVPQKIIIYRDGVGDGQMETVIKTEVAQVVNGIKFYMRDCHADQEDPHVSYVIVQKRINAKLSQRDRGRVINPMPGSYLDHTITHPEYNDFYLVSQHVNQGTVSPTKYVVLTETGTLKMTHHQKLAYKMTHMYYNWCGTVRVPAPCQYAHKLAYLCGQNIKQSVSAVLDEKLYYL